MRLQDKVCEREILSKKVGNIENIADALIEAVNAETPSYHVESSDAECRQNRDHIATTMTEEHIDNKDNCAEGCYSH